MKERISKAIATPAALRTQPTEAAATIPVPLPYSVRFKLPHPLSSTVEVPVRNYELAEALARALQQAAGIPDFIVTKHRKVIAFLEDLGKVKV